MGNPLPSPTLLVDCQLKKTFFAASLIASSIGCILTSLADTYCILRMMLWLEFLYMTVTSFPTASRLQEVDSEIYISRNRIISAKQAIQG